MNIQVDLRMHCSYTNQLIQQVLEEHNETFDLNPSTTTTTVNDQQYRLFWLEYEDLDFDMLYHSAKQSHDKIILANSFCIRKGLLRKANFALFVRQYLSKVCRKNPISRRDRFC